MPIPRIARHAVLALLVLLPTGCGSGGTGNHGSSGTASGDSVAPVPPARRPRPMILDSEGLGEIGPETGFSRDVVAAVLPGFTIREVELMRDDGAVPALRAMRDDTLEVEILPDATGSRPERIFVTGPAVPGPRGIRVGTRLREVPDFEAMELRCGRGRLSGTVVGRFAGETSVYLAFGPESGYWEPGTYPDGPVLAESRLRMLVWSPVAADLVDLDGPAGPAETGGADRVERVRFAKGNTHTWLHDRVPTGGSIRYFIFARKDQTVELSVRSVDPALRISVSAEDGAPLLEEREASATATWTHVLARSGDHTLRVSLPGDSAGGAAVFWIRLAIR